MRQGSVRMLATSIWIRYGSYCCIENNIKY
uniref:Uncharacterized protein n=1 Tax=Arundo donax TaxID=35708 RepID=A0A0A9BRQ4_ARUDO